MEKSLSKPTYLYSGLLKVRCQRNFGRFVKPVDTFLCIFHMKTGICHKYATFHHLSQLQSCERSISSNIKHELMNMSLNICKGKPRNPSHMSLNPLNKSCIPQYYSLLGNLFIVPVVTNQSF